MLRITRVASTSGKRVLKLEGKLVGPWVDVLARACADQTEVATLPALELAAVSFVDRAGVKLLRKLLEQGCELTACSGLVAELLHEER
jgi:ABC-type transporter Mla MlaB component